MGLHISEDNASPVKPFYYFFNNDSTICKAGSLGCVVKILFVIYKQFTGAVVWWHFMGVLEEAIFSAFWSLKLPFERKQSLFLFKSERQSGTTSED